MKVKIDDEVIFEIDNRMIKLFAHETLDPIQEIKRRLRWVIEHKCDQCFERLINEWTKSTDGPSKLEKCGVTYIPTNKQQLCDLIFSCRDYKNRSQRKN